MFDIAEAMAQHRTALLLDRLGLALIEAVAAAGVLVCFYAIRAQRSSALAADADKR